MKQRTLELFLPDALADWEIGFLTAHLAGGPGRPLPGSFTIRTVAESKAPRTTMGGLRVAVDATLDEVASERPAVFVLPGSSAWDEGQHGAALERAKALVDDGVVVAAICGATSGLARVGLLDDRDHTSNAREYLLGTGYAGTERYVEAPAVFDRGVVTAGATDAVAWTATVMRAVDAYTSNVIDAWEQLYLTSRPEHFFALMTALQGGGEAV